MNQIAVSRVDLNSVKTGFFRVQSGDAEILYQLPDLTDGQLPRDFLIPGQGIGEQETGCMPPLTWRLAWRPAW